VEARPRETFQHYGFALPESSPLRKEINRALLKFTAKGFFDESTRSGLSILRPVSRG